MVATMNIKAKTRPHRSLAALRPCLFFAAAAMMLCFCCFIQTAQNQDAPRDITATPVERQLTGIESHLYKIKLKTGEFFQVIAEQKGIDISLKLTDGGGDLLAFANRPTEIQGTEILSFTASYAAEFQLEVRGVNQYAAKGTYAISRAISRTATANDKKRIALEKLFSQGVAMREVEGQEGLARVKFEQVVTGARELNDRYMIESAERQIKVLNDEKFTRASILLNTADRLRGNGTIEEWRTAITKLNDSRRLFHELKTPEKEALVLDTLAMTYRDLGENKKAFEAFNQALSILPATEVEGKAAILSGLAEYYATIGENRRALAMYEQVLNTTPSIRGGLGEAMVRRGIGAAYYGLDEFADAIACYKQSLDVLDKIPEKHGRDDLLFDLGKVYSKLKANEKALDYYDQAVKIYHDAPNNDAEGLVLASIGYEFANQNDPKKAIEFYDRALKILIDAGNKRGQTIVNNNYGALYASLDEKALALKYYNRALSLSHLTPDENLEAFTHNNLGLLYNKFGENEMALKQYDEAIKLSKKNDNRSLEALTLINMGFLYSGFGDSQTAVNNFNKALSLARDLGNIKVEAFAMNNIGLAYAGQRRRENALESFDGALRLDKTLEAVTLNNIGAVYMTSNDFQKALDYFQRALPLARAKGDGALESATLNNIGWAFQSKGDRLTAVEYFNQALPIYKASGDRRGEAGVLNNLLHAWDMLGKRRFAIFYGKHAVKNLQSLRADITGIDKSLQQSFLGTVDGAYRKLTDMLMAEGRLEEAQQTLNSFKDQEYFDPNTAVRKQSTPLALTPREAEIDAIYQQKSDDRAAIVGKTSAFKREIGDHKPTEAETAELRRREGRSAAADKDFSDFLAQAGTLFGKPVDDNDKVSSITDVAEMKAVLRDLQTRTGQSAVAIYTLQGEDDFRGLIVTPEKLAAFASHVKAADLKQKAVGFHDRLSLTDPQKGGPGSSETEVKKSAKELSDIVFAPIEAKLKEMQVDPATLMWSLDGDLRYLPIGALFDGDKYLAERYRNVVFTRANSERMTASVSQTWMGTGFYTSKEFSLPVVDALGRSRLVGFSALKNAESEVESIFGISPKKGILGGDMAGNERFTKESLFRALKLNRPLVHIASHFRFEAGDSNLSFLLLGDGGKLTLEDIKNAPDDLFKGVELLTLSACETAVQKGRASDGREIDGFAELAQRKGAKAVLASLWKVDDQSTSRLMTRFYETHQTNKVTKAEALQRAQLSLIADKQFSHPYYWAPFILIGNWR